STRNGLSRWRRNAFSAATTSGVPAIASAHAGAEALPPLLRSSGEEVPQLAVHRAEARGVVLLDRGPAAGEQLARALRVGGLGYVRGVPLEALADGTGVARPRGVAEPAHDLDLAVERRRVARLAGCEGLRERLLEELLRGRRAPRGHAAPVRLRVVRALRLELRPLELAFRGVDLRPELEELPRHALGGVGITAARGGEPRAHLGEERRRGGE